jgi:hypothetical protein
VAIERAYSSIPSQRGIFTLKLGYVKQGQLYLFHFHSFPRSNPRNDPRSEAKTIHSVGRHREFCSHFALGRV